MIPIMTKNGIFRLCRLTKFIDDTAVIKYGIDTDRRIDDTIRINSALYKSSIDAINTTGL